MELRHINIESGQFEGADGVIFQIDTSFSVERYCEFQLLEKELATGLSVKTLFDKLKLIYALLDKTQFANAAVQINDIMSGIAKIGEREPTVLKICALICNTKDEDRSTITADQITQKINNWKKAGIDFADFFALASTLVPTLIQVYREFIQNISELSKIVEQGNSL